LVFTLQYHSPDVKELSFKNTLNCAALKIKKSLKEQFANAEVRHKKPVFTPIVGRVGCVVGLSGTKKAPIGAFKNILLKK